MASSLALTMIVRDEEAGLTRCLQSAVPHVDEIIVVDTGSTDQTAEIAARHGAKVHHFPWNDDFSAARNHSLALSPCDYNLVLDADEWIIEGGADLKPMLAAKPFIGIVRRKNILNIGGIEQSSYTRIPRLLPRGTHYEGRIHEQPVSFVPPRETALLIEHTGYQAEALAKKKGRNEKLLLLALEEAPDDVYLLYQLGKEYQVADDFAKSAVAFKAALAKSTGQESFRHSLVMRAIFSFKMAEEFEAAIRLVDQEIEKWPQSPDFYFTIGDLYLELALRNPQQALPRFLPVVEHCWKKCLEIGERDDLDGAVRGRGSYMAAHNLATFYRTIGNQQDADKFQAMESEMRARAA